MHLAVTEPVIASERPRNLIRFTPLRYPGGKGKLAPYVKRLITDNKLLDGQYVEPYAGGAAIALELLFHEYVSEVFINDISRPIYAFWKSVLFNPEEFCKKLSDTSVSVETWDKQKAIFAKSDDHGDLDLGFATFFLNRTNRSGILNAGIIGGRAQTGAWGIDARLNKDELAFRIMSISRISHKIKLSRLDAIKFLQNISPKLKVKSLIYLDPPYYKKGRDLYYNFYNHEDHASVARFIIEKMNNKKWIVSYDNAEEIRQLYSSMRCGEYTIGYSARSAGTGSEVMFFSNNLQISPLVGPIKATKGFDNPQGGGKELTAPSAPLSNSA